MEKHCYKQRKVFGQLQRHHVSRTNLYYKPFQLSAEYFTKAMGVFIEDFGGHVAFVMASDSPNWARRYFGHRSDVHILANYKKRLKVEPAVFDFAVLTRCNHSIIRYDRLHKESNQNQFLI